ncbi:MAG: hypothetical protein HYX96_01755 [Chloroflexi bacterium]|nr:hypothetical protein [Chloroflexota bacterium]
MEGRIVYFDRAGQENTDETLRIARQRAGELGIRTILVASTTGELALKSIDVLKGFRVIAVSHSTNFDGPNFQKFPDDKQVLFKSQGGVILTATHIFAGIGRAMRNKFHVYSYTEMISNTLRIFGEGMKVVCEIAMMAADAGLVRTDEDVIAVAGTGRGADTAVVVKPVASHEFFAIKVKEILCKPR